MTTSAPTEAPSIPRSDAIRPFTAMVPEEEIAELRRRLAATRWPDKETVDDQSQGAQLAKLRELVRYWATDYEWRKAETRINAHPQFVTNVDGLDIHFIHVRSPHENALPMILTHGWPGSVFEFLGTIALLTDPTSHGGAAGDAFDVVIPSIPGYGFSERPHVRGWDPDHIAAAWGELMRRLGYGHYVAQGGDWGAPITSSMARRGAPGLRAIHLNLPATVPPDVEAFLGGAGPEPPGLSDEERAVVSALATYRKKGSASYFVMLTARPQAVGYGMTDSPVGLAAFLLVHPGFGTWAYGQDPADRKSRDEVLDDFSLYWLTNSATSAARLYWENVGRGPTSATVMKTSEISLPVAITVFPEDVYRPPESWARRAYRNLAYFHQVDRGGHFAAWEQPELFTDELRAAFRPYR